MVSSEYEPLEVIGKGSFGTVRKVRHKTSGNILVRKEIEYTSMNDHEKQQLVSELRILRELTHPNIVKYYHDEHVPEKKSIHIYMEYCEGGDLAKLISNFKKNKESIPEEFIWQVLVQTLLALYRCHYGLDTPKVNLFGNSKLPRINTEAVVIHRDIKPDNIFLINSGKTIKLGDFGLAKMLTSKNDFAKTYVGTPYYMPPEILIDNPYSSVCDIWSLGCVLFEMCTLQPPFQAKTHLQLQSKIKLGVIPDLPDNYSSQLKMIIKECITVDPDLRPSSFDLMESLSIRFIRKEMELKETNTNLSEFQTQLLAKSEELKKKEINLNGLERKLLTQKEELEQNMNIQKKYLKKLEEELREEFELKKRAMDLEAKEVRLGYQREFKLVVEQEVQERIKEIIISNEYRKNNAQQQTRAVYHEVQSSPKPRGPKDLFEEARRSPLKNRNNEDIDYKASPVRYQANVKKRITDERERVNLEKRHTPEFEEVYLRKNYR
ncbi:Serine/threonine-protein kinase KIN3 [Spathaspora sp. JA1]|nr:Serine/threonine-protein kinase KIN3 [Spathaspora sp. JA1]RLV91973.1 Serine/threonine-protein kinase KIN3 [Spathaspora sp. JA1]